MCQTINKLKKLSPREALLLENMSHISVNKELFILTCLDALLYGAGILLIISFIFR